MTKDFLDHQSCAGSGIKEYAESVSWTDVIKDD